MINFNLLQSKFQCDIDYPFNIYTCFDIEDADGKVLLSKNSQIKDFGTKYIDRLIGEINAQQEQNKIRFMVIHSDGYCRTAAFLERILCKIEEERGILYLPYTRGINLAQALTQKYITNEEYFIDLNMSKICVIDYAEQIDDHVKQIKELCVTFCEKKIIFIFLSRNSTNVSSNPMSEAQTWSALCQELYANMSNDRGSAGIARSQKLYFRLKNYTAEACITILEKLKMPAINSIVQIYRTNEIPIKLRKPYYLDLLIGTLQKDDNQFKDISTATDLLDLIEGIAERRKENEVLVSYFNDIKVKNLKGYIELYLADKKNISKDRIANAWAQGIIHFYNSNENYYNEVLDCIFEKLGRNDNISASYNYEKQIDFELFLKINRELILALPSNQAEDVFSLRQYLLQMIRKDIGWASICASILLDTDIRRIVQTQLFKDCFVSLGKKYAEELLNVNEIFPHIQIGKKLGLLLIDVDNVTIGNGLKHLFASVNDKYILPQTNDNGISVIPVTNYEFRKFVQDGGYNRYYNSKLELHNVAVAYYEHMLEFIIDLLSNVSDESSKKCLSTLLKGYDKFYYEQIAYIYKHCQQIRDNMEQILSVNYPNNLKYPTKWQRENYIPEMLFCNPLQPVVGINIFEARAYSAWLSEKTGKSIRVLSYNPDYISIIGIEKDGIENDQRKAFKKFLLKQEAYINSSEHSDYFYCTTEKGKRDPATVGMPNSKIDGVYDLSGNIFEMQDTYYGEKIEENELERVYNCAGGGLQRTKADWPPLYMGQILGFIRNKDCGFRLVIDRELGNNDPFIPMSDKKITLQEKNIYSECGDSKTFIVQEDTNNSNMVILLRNIIVTGGAGFNSSSPYIISNISQDNLDESNLEILKIFNSGDIKVMLISKNYHIFAYILNEIAFDSTRFNVNTIQILLRRNVLSADSYLRKELTNNQLGDLIDLVIAKQVDGTHYYTTKGLSISNCKFQYAKQNYEISFSGSNDERSKIYDIIKNKLGLDYYLPNWVDLADFIQKIDSSMKQTENDEIDNEIVTSVLTTIDTAYLHEQIDLRGKKNET